MSYNVKRRTALFRIEGIVQRGSGKGKELGFPTANLFCDNSVPSGIYAGEVIWNGVVYPAAIYKEEGKAAVEAHLLDFSGDLYGQRLTILAHRKMRDAKMFSEKAELVAAIAKDIADIKKCSRE